MQRRGPFGLGGMYWGNAQQARCEATARLQLEAAFAVGSTT